MTADTDRGHNTTSKNTHCLICNSKVAVSSRNSCNIFHKYTVTSTDKPVSYTISTVLGQELNEETAHSHVICKKCFKLLNEIDEIEARLCEVKLEITTNYNRSLRIQSEVERDVIELDDDEDDETRKLPLGTDDANIVKQKIVAKSRKKGPPKKLKQVHMGQVGEEDYEQKVKYLLSVCNST